MTTELIDRDPYMNVTALTKMYQVDESRFREKVLPELGLTSEINVQKLLVRLEADYEMVRLEADYEKCVLECISSSESQHMLEEKTVIQENLEKANRAVKYTDSLPATCAKITKSSTFRILHFGIHGSTLRRLNSRTKCLVEKLLRSNIECIFLNACDSKEIIGNRLADLLPHFCIIAWKSEEIDDVAACALAEGFYQAIAVQLVDGEGLKFDDAFEEALWFLELRGFALIEKSDTEGLKRLKMDKGIDDLVATGVPCIYKSRKWHNSDSSDKLNDSTSSGHSGLVGVLEECTLASPDQQSRRAQKRRRAHSISLHDTLIGKGNQDEDMEYESEYDISSSFSSRSTSGGNTAVVSFSPSNLQQNQHPNGTDLDTSESTHSTTTTQKRPNCKFKGKYIFSCGHSIEANCQFIEYGNAKNPSYHDIKGIRERSAAKCTDESTLCPHCNKTFCREVRKIPKDEKGCSFMCCFEAHECKNGGKQKDIRVNRKCKDFELTKRKGTTKYFHCPKCLEGIREEKYVKDYVNKERSKLVGNKDTKGEPAKKEENSRDETLVDGNFLSFLDPIIAKESELALGDFIEDDYMSIEKTETERSQDNSS